MLGTHCILYWCFNIFELVANTYKSGTFIENSRSLASFRKPKVIGHAGPPLPQRNNQSWGAAAPAFQAPPRSHGPHGPRGSPSASGSNPPAAQPPAAGFASPSCVFRRSAHYSRYTHRRPGVWGSALLSGSHWLPGSEYVAHKHVGSGWCRREGGGCKRNKTVSLTLPPTNADTFSGAGSSLCPGRRLPAARFFSLLHPPPVDPRETQNPKLCAWEGAWG